MTAPSKVVFLFDVDNTLLDNDRVSADLRRYLRNEVGPGRAEQYFEIFETLRTELGYSDYLGALQQYRLVHPRDPHLLAVSSFLVNYPFANRLFPGSLDGDVVFQPRKVERSGLFDAVDKRVLIYIHKEHELDDVERRYPADHYVLVDDKIRILTAVKKIWGERLTTVFPRQGHYALAPEVASFPSPDITLARIGDFCDCDLPRLLAAARRK